MPGLGRSDTGAFLAKGRTSSRTECVQTLALDDFWREESCPRVRLAKIDVEGAKLSVLREAANLLCRQQCDYLVVETGIYAQRYGARARDTLALLSRYGYSHVYRFSDEPPYLLPLRSAELDTLNANICASGRPIKFVDALVKCKPAFQVVAQ